MKRNIKLVIEYDGTDFVGWQRQPNGRTVQEEIENVLLKITSEKINVVGSGRTDSGVHAREQVANFFTDNSSSPNDLYRSLNGLLPDDIVIHSAEEVDENFSARYSAKAREYKYYIQRSPTAINRKYCWQLGYALDIDLMNSAASDIVGTHDFQAFCRSEVETEHYLCTVFEAGWERSQNDGFTFTVRANRFMHGMVRAIVGTMVDVGRRYSSLDEFKEIFRSKNRQKAGQSAPPQGLFLERVIY